MNIIVRNYGTDGFTFRPDTTWEREDKDFFSPDFVKSLSFAPVVFARISKAGKCIGSKFVSRYYDGVNFGMLLYNSGAIVEGNPFSGGAASIMDHSSILPFPLYTPSILDSDGNRFTLARDGAEIFSAVTGADSVLRTGLEKALTEASGYLSFRTGDMIVMELDKQKSLPLKGSDQMEITGDFCGNELFRFRIL